MTPYRIDRARYPDGSYGPWWTLWEYHNGSYVPIGYYLDGAQALATFSKRTRDHDKGTEDLPQV